MLLQVEMERRFAAVLHLVVRRLMDSIAPAVRQLLDAQPDQEPAQVQAPSPSRTQLVLHHTHLGLSRSTQECKARGVLW